ncbi:hypothetical protein CJC93_23990, partial [Escherichia coli]|nr:hypothetical protein [Escherichia coli]
INLLICGKRITINAVVHIGAIKKLTMPKEPLIIARRFSISLELKNRIANICQLKQSQEKTNAPRNGLFTRSRDAWRKEE